MIYKVKKIIKQSKLFAFSPAEQRAYEKELDILRLEQGKLDTAERRGLEKGKYEQAMQTAKNLLEMGLSLQQICQATGLDEQTVLKMKNNL